MFEFSATGGLTYFNTAAITTSLGKIHLRKFTTDSWTSEEGIYAGQPCCAWKHKWPGERCRSVLSCPGEPGRTTAADNLERLALEQQLRQAQKMESIGQLAGGVAHDFNNILTVIQGHASLLLSENLTPESTDSAEQIEQSAERAANLTRQLLTFSRRQVLQPRNLDLNEVVCATARMLQRVLGEDVLFKVRYASNLPPVFADRGMIEQVLLAVIHDHHGGRPMSCSDLGFNDATARVSRTRVPARSSC